MIKRIMLIINPCAGRRKGMKKSDTVVSLFQKYGNECSVYMTKQQNDATKFVMDEGSNYDMIVCMGGDGTLNEVINGILKANLDRPLGYIPAGSTNDFARSMHVSKNLETAVRNIVTCGTKEIDVGLFIDRYFCYVSSFGLFTRTSYRTPQRVKNVIGGRTSYILSGILEIGRIRAEHMKMETNGKIYEGDYVFGAVTNSTSVGGILKYAPEMVDMSDGMLEMLLIHKPKNPAQLFSIQKSLASNDFTDNPYIDFTRSNRITVHPAVRSDWSLDGEYAYTTGSCLIKCIGGRIKFICPDSETKE